MRLVFLSFALIVSLAAHAAPKKSVPCTVPASVLDIYSKVENASGAEWDAARTATRNVIQACTAAVPKDPASRALLFSLLKQEMLVHYDPILSKWQTRADEYTAESTAEGILSFQQELLALIDRMVVPADVEDVHHKSIILEYANGLAISKLGPAIKDEVLLQSGGRARFIYGLVLHNRQEENFRAIGYWLDSADKTLTAAEKSKFALALAQALPQNGIVNNEAHARMVTTILDALASSSDPAVEEKLRAWQGVYASVAGAGSSIAVLAGKTADKIKSRAPRQKS